MSMITASCSTGNFRKLLDVDFTAEPTQTLSPDGNYTIGGFTFAKTYSAKEVNATVLTNGVGIVIEPTGDTDNWDNTQNFPRLSINLSASIADFSPATRIRAWLRTSGNYAASYDQSILQLQNVVNGSNLSWERSFGGIGAMRHAQATWFNSSSDGAELADGGYDVYVIDCAGVGLGRNQFLAYSGLWAAGWPAASALVPTYWWSYDTSDAVPYSASFGLPSAWDIAFGAARGAAGSAGFKATFAALKIEFEVVA